MTPTQAQIEAAKKAFRKRLLKYGNAATIFDGEYDAAIVAALTATAEVGIEPINRNNSTNSLSLTAAAEVGEQNTNWIKKRADIRNSAIERCAQVAENYRDPKWPSGSVSHHRKEIAAAIRALKDQQT